MEFSTKVTIHSPKTKITPQDRLLFVGSCFADNIGKRFIDNGFDAVVNPFGVMYNPVSVKHTLERLKKEGDGRKFDWIFITLGTNHVYREIATGEIVDNCQKRPQKLFNEEIMSVEECTKVLEECVKISNGSNIVFTVSPIRYKKYGYHESQLSKATLLLSVDNIITNSELRIPNYELRIPNYELRIPHYFPAYEIVLDELRDYRFYAADMIHPSEQAVDYIFERFRETFFADSAKAFYEEYQPIKQALNHKPFNPESAEYKQFLDNAQRKLEEFKLKWKVC